MTPEDRIRRLTCWTGPITVAPLGGGITNLNFTVESGQGRFVVRIGDDIPLHHILRSNELAASRAAYAAGVSPAVRHHEPGALVIDYIDGRTLTATDFQHMALLNQAVDLIKQAHSRIPRHLRGPVHLFWAFHVIRDYAGTLRDSASQYVRLLPELLAQAEVLEAAIGPIDLIFGHNDLLPANFLHDGTRLWLIDWDYAGFNSPLFDLGGFAANNGLTPDQEAHLLTRYFGGVPNWRPYRAMKAAAALREVLWSMVSEIHSTLDFDYADYTATNLQTYHASFDAFS
ncbi:MAG: phosphotransferase [Pseudorhodobacter sp.]|nr:phosphotransferase [Pseudorhodobacter sp.]